MFDLNSNSALTKKFLTYLAFAPLLTRLIVEADKTGGRGHEKRDRVLDAAGAFIGALAGNGYVPPDVWNDSTRNEVGKLNDALVADMRRQDVRKDVPRNEGESDADYQRRIDEEVQRRKQ